MRVKVKRLEFLEALKKAQAACQKGKYGVEILRMVRMVAANGVLLLTGTDGSAAYITVTCKAQIKTKGAGCVTPDKIITFLSAAATDSVTLVDTGNKLLRIEAGHAAYLVDYQPADNFCDANFAAAIHRHKAKAVHVKGLFSALSDVAYAAAKEDTRPVLTGVLMKFRDGIIELVAADGFRMAISRVKYKSDIHFKKTDSREFILPREAVDLMCRLKEESYTFFIGEGMMMFTSGSVEIGLKPIVGSFPAYEKLIPEHKGKLTLDRAEVLSTLKQFSGKEFNDRAFRIEPKRGGVLVSMSSGDGNAVSCRVSGKSPIKIAFNIKLFKDMLSHLADSAVVMRVSDGNSPALIKVGDSQHILMPLRICW
ncbi:MAG: DNA polymerase III subunit beta [Dehalococcoidia bacterium]|jgi:DNA polymerase-3 subunit beta